MPFVNVKVAGSVDAEQVGRLQREVTRLMADVLGKRAGLTAVAVERTGTASWSVGAEPVRIAAHIDALITAGTNTAQEKADFVGAAHALLADVLGPGLPAATYVVVREIPADSWGYAGRTQAARAVG